MTPERPEMNARTDLTSPVPSAARLALGLLAVAGAVASLIAHLLTFVPGVGVSMHTGLSLLHAAVFPLILAVILVSRAETKGLSRADANRRLLDSLPSWAQALLLLAFCYAILNFALFMIHTGGAAATPTENGYVLTVHGRVIRHITQMEAVENEAAAARGFSGHWMFFYLLPATYFLAKKKEEASEPAAPA